MGELSSKDASLPCCDDFIVHFDELTYRYCLQMWVATGSYAEPLQSDEQPESWHAFTPDLHTARLTANRMREMNFDYRMNKLCPTLTAPGFFSHQSDMQNISGARAWDSNRFIRDFDIVGYKYALLSSVGSAGLNSVVNTLPARDAEEYNAFPEADLSFIRDWLKWTDTHRTLLRSQRPLPIAPGHGKIDGSFMFPGPFGVVCDVVTDPGCPGFIFLFNPNGQAMAPAGPIALGANLGIDCAVSGASATVREVYPQTNRTLAAMVACGGLWTPPIVTGKGVLVVEVSFTTHAPSSSEEEKEEQAVEETPSSPVLVGVEGQVSYDADSGVLALTDLRGEKGSTRRVQVVGLAGLVLTAVTLNGAKLHDADYENQDQDSCVSLKLRFGAGPPFAPSQALTGHWAAGNFSGSFAVPSWVFTQLAGRNKTYPIQWNQNDLSGAYITPPAVASIGSAPSC